MGRQSFSLILASVLMRRAACDCHTLLTYIVKRMRSKETHQLNGISIILCQIVETCKNAFERKLSTSSAMLLSRGVWMRHADDLYTIHLAFLQSLQHRAR